MQFDKYTKEIDIMAKNIMAAAAPAPRMDDAEEKRVELHLHTQMSSMDGVTPVKKYIERAIEWGHKAIAITDHGVVQAFPDAMNAIGKSDLKVIYGVEAYLIDDLGSVVTMPRGQSLDDTFVVFDIETTGLSKETESITEIGAVKVVDGKIIDRFSTFVNPERPIPAEITKLTGITNEMVADAPVITEILPRFLEFCQDAVLVAHNANFDTGFIRLNAERKCGIEVKNTVLDTLELSRSLLPELKKHKLDIVCEQLGVSLEGHHRAVNDAEATAEVFLKFIDMLVEKEIYKVDDINVFSSQTVNYKKLKAYHAIILAKDYVGLRNLYELISLSHIDYYFRRPRIPKSKLIQHREGLILGSACEAGELYRALLDKKPKQVIEELGLKGIRCEHLRAEDAGRDKKHREKYDYVTARAVARLSVLSEYCLPLAKKGGQFIALKGSKFAEEITEGEAAVKILGGKILSAEPVKLPGLDDGRAIIKIAKIKSTPAQYPRKAGTPEKQPLGAK